MELEHRIIKLELRVDDHQEELQKLQDISSDLRKSLAGIEKTLAQIKWIATGAIVVILAQSMGIPQVLKMLI
jgi:predicted  nucleic acid-binding Zn-ribbon protein